MAKSRGRKFAELVAPTNGVFAAASIPTIALSKLASSAVTINSESLSLGGSLTLDTSDIGEHTSNKYFTDARAQATLSVASNSGHGALAYDNSNGQFTFAGITTEAIQDVVGAMFSSNTETAVTVTYQDSDGTIDLVVDDTTKVPLAGGTMTGNLTLGDNVNAYFGASTDLRIYHDGTNSHIINSTGELRFSGSNFAIKSDSAKLYLGASDDLEIFHSGSNSHINHTGTGGLFIDASGDTYFRNTAGTENRAIFKNDGAVELYHNSSKKFETTSGGVTVTGGLTATALSVNSGGSTSDLSGTAIFRIMGGDVRITNAAGSEAMATFAADGAVTLYHDSSAKLATTSTGVQTTGTLNVNGAFAFPTSDGSANQILQTDGSGAVSWVTNTGGTSIWSQSGSDIYYTSGEVGIGTNSPNQIFHIKNTGQHTTMRIENDNADFLIQAGDAGDDGLHFYDLTNTAYRMTIDNAGQVGIGTTTPGSALQINSTDNQKIILSGSNDPYIRWQEGTTNKGYMQWNAAGYFELRNQEVSSYWTLGDAFKLYPTTDEAFVIERSGDSLRQHIKNTNTTGTYSYLQLTTTNSSSAVDSGYLLKNAAQNTGNSLANNSLYLWNQSERIEFVPSGTIANRITVETSGNITSRGASTAGILGAAYGTSYFGLKTSAQTLSSEYMIISEGTHTYISATSGYNVIIRNGGNNSTNQLIVGSGATGLSWRGSTIWTAENDGAGSGLNADLLDNLSSEDFARLGNYTSAFSGTPSGSNRVIFYNASGQSMNSTSGYLSRLECLQPSAGADAFMTFHVSGDYAVYFGLDGATNDLSVGGWSMGANKYKVWHAGNDGASSGLNADLLDGQHGSYYMASTGMATNLDTYVNLRVVRNSGSSAGSDGMYIGYGNAGGGATRIYGGGSTSAYFQHNGSNLTFVNTGLGAVSMAGALTITNQSIRSNATSNWDGNPGAQGKIQYHSNRWYIVADQSSNRIVQFRRNGSDVSYIDNSGTFIGNVTGNINGISTSNLVGAHNNSHSASLQAEVGALHFYRDGANSSQANHAYALYQASGGWSTPYPDLNIAYHTGISLGGNNGYNGIRFFNDYTMATRILQVNGPSNYIFKDVWMHTDSGEGMYSSGNGMHFYPNSGQSSYSPITITGNRGSYGGIFDDYGDVNWMHDSGGNGGNYMSAFGWYFYFHRGNGCLGVAGSSTSSSYGLYEQGGGIYSTGNVVAYSDRRAKENIVTIPNALDKTLKLRGVFYNKIDDETKTRQVGVIAQEMQEILPEAVTYAEDTDEYGVAYGNVVGLLIESIKELKQEVDDLKKKLEEK